MSALKCAAIPYFKLFANNRGIEPNYVQILFLFVSDKVDAIIVFWTGSPFTLKCEFSYIVVYVYSVLLRMYRELLWVKDVIKQKWV